MADETFSTMESALDSCKAKENPLADNKVANFAYDDTAYENNNADGVESYDYNAHNNIPKGTPLVMDTNQTVLDKGYRSQASSITRMLMNHFFGRISYNLNKTVDTVNGLINNMKTFWGRPNGFATLDASGRIPFSQLPESAIEFKGLWNASTNTPTLADGTGTKGDFYIVSVAGTQNLGSGSIQFFVNDRVIYSGEVWTRLTSGDVQTVNGVHPQAGDVKNVIKLTQEQFDTLSSAEKAGKFFIVTTSYAVGQSEINDNVTASDTTWSSNKIVSNLTGALTDYNKIINSEYRTTALWDCNDYLGQNIELCGRGLEFSNIPTIADAGFSEILMAHFTSRCKNTISGNKRSIQTIELTYWANDGGWQTHAYRRFAIDSTIFDWELIPDKKTVALKSDLTELNTFPYLTYDVINKSLNWHAYNQYDTSKGIKSGSFVSLYLINGCSDGHWSGNTSGLGYAIQNTNGTKASQIKVVGYLSDGFIDIIS